jgi:hypothetical protein
MSAAKPSEATARFMAYPTHISHPPLCQTCKHPLRDERFGGYDPEAELLADPSLNFCVDQSRADSVDANTARGQLNGQGSDQQAARDACIGKQNIDASEPTSDLSVELI